MIPEISILIKDFSVQTKTEKEGGFGMGRCLDFTALIIAVIGALNWGLIGLFGFDLVAMLFGEMSALSRIVYVLVGISGLWLLTFFGKVAGEDD